MAAMVTINETDKEFQVSFPYSDWIVRAVKQIPGRRFIGTKKYWVIPLSSRRELMTWATGFEHMVVKNKVEPEISGDIDPLPELTIELPIRSDVKQIFHYQKQGVAYGLDKKQTFVADEQGLGKTVQAIAITEAGGCKCILIICPATLMQNWKREIETTWTHKKALVLTDRIKKTWPTFWRVGSVKYFICTYQSLKKYFVDKIEIPKGEAFAVRHITFNKNIELFDGIIVDEIHRCKDGGTQQSKFVMGISRKKPIVLALTGTPLINKPFDLVPQLHIIGKLHLFGGYEHFIERYCSGKNKASNLKELNYLLHKHCFYRRLKKDVLKDLPAKLRNVVRCDITNMAEYQKAENNLSAYLRDNLNRSGSEITKTMRGKVLASIQILKKIAAMGKLEYIIEHIRGVIESGEKFGLFAWHTDVVKSIVDEFPGTLTITGQDTLAERDASVRRFQNDPECRLIVCNIKSGGEGLTLTAASRMGFIELPYHPAGCDQCEDRFHRIGQLDSVECNYFLGNETIDEDLYKIIERKREIVGDAIGSDEDITTNMVDEFINLFKQKL